MTRVLTVPLLLMHGQTLWIMTQFIMIVLLLVPQQAL
uniref:Uncharacterized protein n=1 Tax=Picea sitchensis TaxID=3332 RepID=A0A6B9XYS4_PICSI|nr:hypothetical protein Q903MT_gene5813 [Picea sitchensis]